MIQGKTRKGIRISAHSKRTCALDSPSTKVWEHMRVDRLGAMHHAHFKDESVRWGDIALAVIYYCSYSEMAVLFRIG